MASYSTDPALYIYTSLTAGSSHIVTATSRLETILRANRVPFKAVDLAVDQKARMLWGRRAGKDEGGRMRKLPGLVQEGMVLGDIVEIEDWNEYGELKQHVKIYYDEHTIPSINQKLPDPPLKRPINLGGGAPSASKSAAKSTAVAAAAAAAAPKPAPPAPPLPETKTSAPAAKPAEAKKEEKTLPVRSVAEDAAQKAKELRLQSLREKVHGKGGKKTDEKETSETTKKTSTGSAKVAEASPDEIKAVEAKTAIKEEPKLEDKAAKKPSDSDDDSDDSDEDDSDEDDDDSDEDDTDDDDDDDEQVKKPATATPAAKDKPKEARN
ncbi:hypothetical protein F66182_4301 [Fusarium sp. NRRL 66182]|nr:hypothetical protein F66182_4301 [Fusarium sp. NRRL 66182]